jgi:predicted nucleotidyltransferase
MTPQFAPTMRIIAAVDHVHPHADKENANWLFRSTGILKQAWFMHPDDLKTIKTVLAKNPAIVFAYLYGSAKDSVDYRDIDIAVYSKEESDPFRLSADLKIELSDNTGRPPDSFDVRVINHLLDKGDLFSLLYLSNVLNDGMVLADRDFPTRAEFIEAFGMKYRECEGLIAEVLV